MQAAGRTSDVEAEATGEGNSEEEETGSVVDGWLGGDDASGADGMMVSKVEDEESRTEADGLPDGNDEGVELEEVESEGAEKRW